MLRISESLNPSHNAIISFSDTVAKYINNDVAAEDRELLRRDHLGVPLHLQARPVSAGCHRQEKKATPEQAKNGRKKNRFAFYEVIYRRKQIFQLDMPNGG